jgi:hypothetical protein
MDDFNLYTPEDRSEALKQLLDAAESDSSIGAGIIVGSGAYGFLDEYSDIDLSFVVTSPEVLHDVFDQWRSIVPNLFPVFEHTESIRGDHSLLHVYMLDNCLEVDIGFICFNVLAGKRKHWKVAFDRIGGVEEKLADTWESLQDSHKERLESCYTSRIKAIWHYIQHCAVAIKRNRLWQAVSDIEDMRMQAVTLHAFCNGLDPGRYHDVDGMENEFRSTLAGTLVKSINQQSLAKALREVAACFFREAKITEKELGQDKASRMEVRMNEYLRKLKLAAKTL